MSSFVLHKGAGLYVPAYCEVTAEAMISGHDAMVQTGGTAKTETVISTQHAARLWALGVTAGSVDGSAEAGTKMYLETAGELEKMSPEDRLQALHGLRVRFRHHFDALKINGGGNFQNALAEGLNGRVDLVVSQLVELGGAAFKQGGIIYDYGGGTGDILLQLMDRYGNQASADNPIQGVMQEVGDYRSDAARQSAIDCHIVPDREKSPEKFHGKVQNVVLTNVLHHSMNPDAILADITTLLKTGGHLHMIETVAGPSGVAPIVGDWTYNHTMQFPVVHDGKAYQWGNPTPGNYRTPQDWKAAAEKHGFQLVQEKARGNDVPIVGEEHHHFVFVKI